MMTGYNTDLHAQRAVQRHQLTQRERECLLHAARGLSIKQTAEVMAIRPSTVKWHRMKVIEKLRCHSILRAVYCYLGQNEERSAVKFL